MTQEQQETGEDGENEEGEEDGDVASVGSSADGDAGESHTPAHVHERAPQQQQKQDDDDEEEREEEDDEDDEEEEEEDGDEALCELFEHGDDEYDYSSYAARMSERMQELQASHATGGGDGGAFDLGGLDQFDEDA